MTSKCCKMAMARLCPVEPAVKQAAVPWDGSLARMRESALVAWQVGELLTKQAGIGSIIRAPLEVAGHGVKALWKGTSTATKAKIGLTGAGLGVGAVGLGLGSIGSNAIGGLSNISSVPNEQEKQALSNEIAGLWQGAKSLAPALGKKGLGAVGNFAQTGAKAVGGDIQSAVKSVRAAPGKIQSFVSPAARQQRFESKLLNKTPTPAVAGPSMAGQYSYERGQSRGLVSKQRSQQKVEQFGQRFGVQPTNPTQVTPIQMSPELRRAAAGQRLQQMTTKGIQPGGARIQPAPITGQVGKPPAAPPKPVAVPQAPPSPQQNAPAMPQQATQPTGQPPAQQPLVGTVGRKGQQAAVQSADQGAAATQTPQDAGKGTLGKVRGALPWLGGAAALGIGGTMVGAGMLGNRAIKEMGREGQLNNTYQGYGVPIAGSASPYGYVTGPSG